MNGPAFLGADLVFGRHNERWDFEDDGPLLIAGPNGSGKSTLIDGLLRTVFGFNRKRPAESRLCDARAPWDDEEFRSTIRLRTDGGDVLVWSRDHRSDHVEVRREDGATVFQGTANPASSGAADRAYWDLVRRVFGVERLEGYAGTAYVGQGTLLDTAFGSDLLRLTEGGHARLQKALERIEARHRELTREAISPDSRRLSSDKRLECDRRAQSDVERRLSVALAARDERDAATERLDALVDEGQRLEREIERLEAVRAELAERGRLDAEADAAEQRLDHLVELREELDVAHRDVRAADEERSLHEAFAAYPEDFSARVERLRAAWENEARITRSIATAEQELALTEPGPSEFLLPLLAGGLGLATALAAVVLEVSNTVRLSLGLTATVLVGGAVAGAWRLAGRRAMHRSVTEGLARLREETADLDARIRTTLDGIPEAATLTPRTAEERLHGFARYTAATHRLGDARRRHREAVRRIEESAEARATPGRSLPHLVSDAERRLAEIRLHREHLQEKTAPPGEPSTSAEPPLTARAVDAALRDRRQGLADLRAEREDVRIRLDRSSREAAEAMDLERQADELRQRIAETESAVEALRRAYALLRDGYAAFRDQDESRLVAAISSRLGRLGRPGLGPFRTRPGLEEPTVELAGRRLPVDSFSLSHGQRHLVKLAIRIGAADFLAAEDVAAPLIVDEPFAHLDDRHALEVWELLDHVSAERQVIVSTQESALLARLGIEPAIRLPGRVSNGGPAIRRGGEGKMRPSTVGAETPKDDATS